MPLHRFPAAKRPRALLPALWAVLLGIAITCAPLAASFDSVPRFIGSADLPRDPTAHDVDGDGDLDLVYLDGNESDDNLTEIGWFENNRSGTTWTRHILETGHIGPASLKIVDLNRDDRQDLVVGLRSGFQLLWFPKGTGAGFGRSRVLRDQIFRLEDVDAGDLNGDGRIDLVVPSDSGPRWLRQTPGVTFANPAVIATTFGTSPEFQAVEIFDFDGDGDQDVVTAIAALDRIFFSRNNGNGTFASPVDLDTPNRPYALDRGDIDRDGNMDIVAAARDLNEMQIFWFRNNGNGTFGRKQILASTASDVASVVVADFDRDGDQDIAAAATRGPVFWFENLRRGTFSEQKNIGDGGGFMLYLSKGDLDGDGDEDLIAAQWDSDRFVWYRNTTPIPTVDPPQIDLFQADDTSVASSATLRWQTTDATSVEINPDVGAVSTTGSHTLSVTETGTYTLTARNSEGTATAQVTIVVGEPPIIREFSADDNTVTTNTQAELSWEVDGAESLILDPAPGAVTGDSFSPVMTETTTFTLRAVNEFGESTAEETIRVGTPPTITALRVDSDAISLSEVTTLRWSATGAETTFVSGVGEVPVGQAIAVQPGNTTTYEVTVHNDFGSASRSVTITVSGDLFNGISTRLTSFFADTWNPMLADMNGDGLDDLLVVSTRSGSAPAALRWFPRTGPGTFGGATTVFTREAPGLVPFAADLDGDGDIDAGMSGGAPPQWAPNNGDGSSFGPIRTITPLPGGGGAPFIGNLNGDPFLDIAGDFAEALRVYPGAANGEVGTEQFLDDFDGEIRAVPFAAGDLDGDGDIDLVAGKDLHGEVFWYKNEEGIFTNKRPVRGGYGRLLNILTEDTDNDGDLDILIRFSGNALDLLVNPGDGDFASVAPRRLNSRVSSIRDLDFADLDLDGDSDLIYLAEDELEFRENTGGNNFPFMENFEFESRVFSRRMAIGDIDSDRDPDIIIADTGGERVLAFENQFTPFAAPVANDPFPTLTLSEDFGESRLRLSNLFSDLDTRGNLHTYSILSQSGDEILATAGIEGGDELVLQSMPNLHGQRNFIVRAVDPEGLLSTVDLAVVVTAVDDPPTATDPSVTGPGLAGGTLNAAFTYFDVEDDPPAAHLYQWFRADQPDGTGRTDIPGATSASYILSPDEVGSHVGIEIVPVASSGEFPTGLAVTSSTIGPVEKAPTSLTITSDTPDPSLVGAAVEVQFTLDFDDTLAATPTGTFTITAPGAAPVVIAVPTNEGSIVLPQAGTQELSVVYSGDGSFHGSSDIEEHQVLWQVGITLDAPREAPEDSAGTFQAVVSRIGDTDVPLLINLVIGGTASLDEDYSVAGATINSATIPADQTSAEIAITTLVENLEEDDETITITLLPGDDYSLINDQTIVTATILNDDFAPVANPDAVYMVVEDTPQFFDANQGVLANDTDQDDGNLPGLSIVAVLQEAPTHGDLELNPNGSFTYTPDSDYFGPDSFVYAASDGTNQSGMVTVEIAVTELVDLVISGLEDPEVVGAPDRATHGVTVTNAGPSDAVDVVIHLSQGRPSGVSLEQGAPSIGSARLGAWTIPLLREGESATLDHFFDVSASALGAVNAFYTTAEVQSAAQPLTNPDDDSALLETSIVSPANIGVLEVDVAPGLNLQTGLFTQKVTITNNNPLPLAGFRLIVGNLPADVQVHNAHGKTPGGDAYIESNAKLDPGKAITLTIEFFRPSLDPDFDPSFSIEAAFVDDLPEPAPADGGASIDRLLVLDNGDFLIEFRSLPGTAYAIEYTHDMQNWHRVVPTVTANATRTQWIDSGPPKTSSHPSTVPGRCYRIVTLSN